MPIRPVFLTLIIYIASISQAIENFKINQTDSDSQVSAFWKFSTEVYFYYLPEEDFYTMPIISSDHGQLHLEARYNYEDSRSLSFFAGRTFSIGEKLQLEVIPMMGGVVGNTLGIIPALEFDLAYWNLEFYSEAEYVYDLQDEQGNYFYNWADLSYYPLAWLQLGISSQQTREKANDWFVEHGLLLGLNYRDYSLVSHLFNPGEDKQFYILSGEISF